MTVFHFNSQCYQFQRDKNKHRHQRDPMRTSTRMGHQGATVQKKRSNNEDAKDCVTTQLITATYILLIFLGMLWKPPSSPFNSRRRQQQQQQNKNVMLMGVVVRQSHLCQDERQHGGVANTSAGSSGSQPPVTITSVFPWANKKLLAQLSQPPVTLTDVLPWFMPSALPP